MTVEEFYAFTDTRPDEEKWELIEGELDLECVAARHASLDRAECHCCAHDVALTILEREIKAPWVALADLGVRVSEKSRPEPDVVVYSCEHQRPEGRRDRSDVLVVFDVLSPSTEKRDLGWKRKAYPSLPSLVRVFARDDAFEGRQFRSLGERIGLPSLGISLPIAEIYHDTGLTA